MSALIKGGRVRINHRAWPFLACQRFLLCPTPSILIAGCRAFMDRPLPVRSARMAVSRSTRSRITSNRRLPGQGVVLFVNAPEKLFEVWHGGTLIKQLPIKGLHGAELPFERYVTLMKQEARSE